MNEIGIADRIKLVAKSALKASVQKVSFDAELVNFAIAPLLLVNSRDFVPICYLVN